MNNFRENDILILIGAGCSKEAGIPTSKDMVNEIESLIKKDDNEWKKYKDLYYFIKNYIYGPYGKCTESLNIEHLVTTLNKLEKREEHLLLPFIRSWNFNVVEFVESDLRKIKELKKKIIKKLKEWVTIDDYSIASYYKHFFTFQREIQFPLRVFSLNYDVCFEKNKNNEYNLELGFDEKRRWQWQKFEKNENASVNIYLYKMHGSINWKRNNDGFLTYSDEIINVNNPEIIFGTNYESQYIDPYFFYICELRKYSLEAKLIVTIGYGYYDEYINGIISQALINNKKTKLIANLYKEHKEKSFIEEHIKSRLKITDKQLICENMKASEFLKECLKLDYLSKHVDTDSDFDI